MNLNLMTVSELRKLAAQFGIAGRSTMKKAELVRELTDPNIADLVELSVTVDEIEETAVVAEPSVYEDPAVRAAIRETVAEQATYIEEGIEMDEADAAEHYTLPDQVAITKYAANDAIATAAFAGTTVGGRVTRERGRWVLRDQTYTIRAKTLSKVGKLWAKKLGFHATAIDVASMS